MTKQPHEAQKGDFILFKSDPSLRHSGKVGVVLDVEILSPDYHGIHHSELTVLVGGEQGYLRTVAPQAEGDAVAHYWKILESPKEEQPHPTSTLL